MLLVCLDPGSPAGAMGAIRGGALLWILHPLYLSHRLRLGKINPSRKMSRLMGWESYFEFSIYSESHYMFH